MSMEQDERNSPGGIHVQVPSEDTSTLVEILLSMSLSALHDTESSFGYFRNRSVDANHRF